MTPGYRGVLALPGVAPLMTVSLLARVPASAAAITLTLHVVLTLDLGYAAAGAVGAASTIGMAIGAPTLGRFVDRRGLRTMLAVTTAAAAVFWSVAPYLTYPTLLVGAFLGGLLAFPVYSIIRQALASAVPEGSRRPAFALDSMSVEVSYIIGPAVGSLLVVTLSSPVAMAVVGAGWVATGLAFWVLDPPTRTGTAEPGERPPSVRTWLDRWLVAALLGTAATVLLLFGTELSVIASVQGVGPVYAIALAAGSERVSVLAPEPARGVVTGLHGSATTLGAAAGTPLAGLLIDTASPAVAIVVVGVVGAALAGVAALLGRRVPAAL
ncbi:MFS transporter [Pseudonocardia abyssalis]|uniref:MFS transporter n=1 Tax=Pseudonocardia abyssalis TaxID=2792008 RepID=A0ABS6UXG1_9PSEU|nr:MFS transporter [Pseudonocardia abyssalis]MBW0118425.1 MFS transporter [Pseudonocardia abyssalis]MBW0136968.1 MFS transporter [Pseudonocardia abyssalis]